MSVEWPILSDLKGAGRQDVGRNKDPVLGMRFAHSHSIKALNPQQCATVWIGLISLARSRLLRYDLL